MAAYFGGECERIACQRMRNGNGCRISHRRGPTSSLQFHFLSDNCRLAGECERSFCVKWLATKGARVADDVNRKSLSHTHSPLSLLVRLATLHLQFSLPLTALTHTLQIRYPFHGRMLCVCCQCVAWHFDIRCQMLIFGVFAGNWMCVERTMALLAAHVK